MSSRKKNVKIQEPNGYSNKNNGKRGYLSREKASSLSIRDLKQILRERNVDTQGFLEKKDFVQGVMDSQPPPQDEAHEEYPNRREQYGSATAHQRSALANQSVRDLKKILRGRGVDPSSFLEKDEIIEKVIETSPPSEDDDDDEEEPENEDGWSDDESDSTYDDDDDHINNTSSDDDQRVEFQRGSRPNDRKEQPAKSPDFGSNNQHTDSSSEDYDDDEDEDDDSDSSSQYANQHKNNNNLSDESDNEDNDSYDDDDGDYNDEEQAPKVVPPRKQNSESDISSQEYDDDNNKKGTKYYGDDDEEEDPEEKLEKLTRRRKLYIIMITCLCCCLFILITLVLLVAFLTGDPETNNDSNDDPNQDNIINRNFRNDPIAEELNGWITTPMDPYDPLKTACDNFSNLQQPYVINQCECNGYINNLANDVIELRNFLAQHFMPYIYPYDEDEEHLSFSRRVSVTSCDPRNQALVWLSSGNVRSGGDLTQRYVLALFYIEMNGINWDDASPQQARYNTNNDPELNWLSEGNECSWPGLQCRTSEQLINILHISNNPSVIGQIPSEIAVLTALEQLNLAHNEIVGSIPTELGRLSTQLRLVNLEHNQITAPLPSELGLWRGIEFLYLGENYNNGTNTTSTIPTELGNIGSSIKELRLNDIFTLTGTLPTEFSNFNNIERLDLNGNQLSGTIMTEFGFMTSLKYLSLSRNENISGDIPTQLGLLSNMLRVDFSRMDLTGTVPLEVGNLIRLEGIALEENRLTGSIAQSICDLRGYVLHYFSTDCLSFNGNTGVDCSVPSCCTVCI